jgi:hypothetical protein
MRRVDRMMDLGITCLVTCGEETCTLYIHLMYNVVMSVEKLKEMMKHIQPNQVPNWLPTEMWTMAKNYLTEYENKVPSCTSIHRTGSGDTWRSGCNAAERG